MLAEGQYYLVENSAPEGYKVNATAVPILVDDEHGVMADAGTPNDGVAVTVAEGHLVPTMTPFATADDIDRTLTNITSTKKTAASGWANTSALQKTGNTVDLTLDTKKFDPNDYANTLRYIPVDSHNENVGWSLVGALGALNIPFSLAQAMALLAQSEMLSWSVAVRAWVGAGLPA